MAHTPDLLVQVQPDCAHQLVLRGSHSALSKGGAEGSTVPANTAQQRLTPMSVCGGKMKCHSGHVRIYGACCNGGRRSFFLPKVVNRAAGGRISMIVHVPPLSGIRLRCVICARLCGVYSAHTAHTHFVPAVTLHFAIFPATHSFELVV